MFEPGGVIHIWLSVLIMCFAIFVGYQLISSIAQLFAITFFSLFKDYIVPKKKENDE